MMDSFFEYKHQIIRTGDVVQCLYNGQDIKDAKIYVCSAEEIVRVAGENSRFSQIIFICNNKHSTWNPGTHDWNPNFLGYKLALGTGLLTDFFSGKPILSWSDGVSNVEKTEKDKLKEVIDQMILKDKLSIQGVYKHA